MEKEFGARYLDRYHHKPGSIPFVSNDIWIELDGKEDVPVSTPKRFYHPKKNLRKEWPDILKMRYGIKPNKIYDTKVSGLILEVTPEMLEKERVKHSAFEMNMAAEDYLQLKKYSLILDLMDQEQPTIPGIKKSKQRFYEDLTDFEKRILQWEPEYGILVDHRAKSEGFFTQAEDKDIKYEIEREYFFNLPTYSELFISLAQEINTNRAIWGLRRSIGLDWPFDSQTTTRRPDNVDETIREMNQFLLNLEQMIS